MTMLANDPLTQLSFSIYENKGTYAVLLGSGLSRAAEIPTGWEITIDLIRRIAKLQGAKPQSDWEEWYRKTIGKDPSYSALLEALASSPSERRSILQSYIEPDEEDREEGRKIPTAAHRAIAELVRANYIRVIVTTNFDRLLENALRDAGVEPTVVASVDALLGAEPITHSQCYILKLHGDYKDARILNTDEELGNYPPEYDRLLDRILDEFGLIICGWSGEWDHALRAAILRAPNRRYPVYWTSRGRVSDAARELINHRKARVVEITDSDHFFSALSRHVLTLEQSRRQNPLSAELQVNSTKRYLAKPEYRIQLDELFASEMERLLSQLDSEFLSDMEPFDATKFGDSVARYEAASEGLTRMAGVLGRWGDGTEQSIVLDMLGSVKAHADKQRSGTTVWLDLRSYPAVLIFTSYGLGLVRAQRWSALHTFLTADLASRNQETQRVVNTLCLNFWEGGDSRIWQALDGLAGHHLTAFNDHLLSLFRPWSKDFGVISQDWERLFERFEILASISTLETTSKTELQRAFDQPAPYNFVRMPLGRSFWPQERRERLIHEISANGMQAGLLRAGFAGGDSEYFSLMIENLQHTAARFN